jgi:hypothetical protein
MTRFIQDRTTGRLAGSVGSGRDAVPAASRTTAASGNAAAGPAAEPASLGDALAALASRQCTGWTVERDRCERRTSNPDGNCGQCAGLLNDWPGIPVLASKAALTRLLCTSGVRAVCVDSDDPTAIGMALTVVKARSKDAVCAVDAPGHRLDGYDKYWVTTAGPQLSLSADGRGWAQTSGPRRLVYRLVGSDAHLAALREGLGTRVSDAAAAKQAADEARNAAQAARTAAARTERDAARDAWSSPCQTAGCTRGANFEDNFCKPCRAARRAGHELDQAAADSLRDQRARLHRDLLSGHPDGMATGRVEAVGDSGRSYVQHHGTERRQAGRLFLTAAGIGLLPTGKRKKGIALFDTEGSMGFGGWHPREVWALDRKGERSVLLYSDSMDAHLQRPSGPPVWDRVLAEPARVRETATTLLADGWTGTADELLDTARLLAS